MEYILVFDPYVISGVCLISNHGSRCLTQPNLFFHFSIPLGQWLLAKSPMLVGGFRLPARHII